MSGNRVYSTTMFICSKVVFVVIFINSILERNIGLHANKISVGYYSRQPFVKESKNGGVLDGLDALIVVNFARKYNFQIKFIRFSSPLTEIFKRNEKIENHLLTSNLQ